MPQQVVIFVDSQNTYRGARRAFFSETDPHIYGTIDPLKLGQLIVSRSRPGLARELKEVRMYTGRPAATKSPIRYAAHMKQCSYWESLTKVTVIPRQLRYPYNWPHEREREKGIDVAIAIDFVSMAIDGYYDVGILVTTDTDLVPALEYVVAKCNPSKVVEVAAWNAANQKSRLRVQGQNVWCHLLFKSDYELIEDPTDYRP